MSRLGAQLESEPEGKLVEAIEVVVLDVFETRDPAPQFLNWFHVNTLESVVRREILLRQGQTYRGLLAAESERNLRKFVQFSVVIVTPIKGSKPGTVRILVVTKDVWSLRVSWDPGFSQGKLTSLLLTPSEWNLFGTTQSLGAVFSATPNNLWVGGAYTVPRVAGSRIAARLAANAQLNCRTGEAEGASFQFSYGQPLYSTRTKWAWGVNANYASQIGRPGFGNVSSICSFPGAAGVRVALDPDDAARGEETPVAYIPYVYRAETVSGDVGVTRSFFVRNKVNVSLGLEAVRSRYTPAGDASEIYLGSAVFDPDAGNRTCWPPSSRCPLGGGLDVTPGGETELAEARARFAEQRLLPGAQRIGPYAQVNAFETNFVRLLNVNTLGLQEDVQLGHSASLRVYPGLRPLASRNLFGTVSSIAYTLPWRGGVYRLSASSTLVLSGKHDDYAYSAAGRSSLADTTIEIQSQLVSPSFGWGRLVMGTAYGDHPQWRFVQPQYELGSADRLRGYSPSTFVGRTVFINNLELRTVPLQLFSTLVGATAFWDVGSAGGGLSRVLRPYRRANDVREGLAHGVGLGLRILLPQIDRQVFRIDLGMPLQRESQDPAYTLTAGFRQVFGDN